ncbi:MAG: alpha/beta fold hydrolase [Solirubrobacteraceae bacterium]
MSFLTVWSVSHGTLGERPSVRGSCVRSLVAVLGVVLWIAIAVPPASARAASPSVVELPVSFQVTNSNTSQDPCLSDGGQYTIRGHITGPASALGESPAPPVTMYLYGYEGGEWNWDLKRVPGYDYAAEMARLGHVSLTLDELGYGASDHPQDGNLTCQGALADIAHQIIGDLRSGDYSLQGGPGIQFTTVVLAGHDVGGQVAEIEAYSYNDINGLILATWADQGFTPWIIERSVIAANDWCTASPLQTPPGSPTSYVHFVSDHEFRTLLFYDANPHVIAATAAQRNPNPCGIMRSGPIAVQFDPAKTQSVTTPLLDVYGAQDTLVWSHAGEAQQQDNFGSKDKTTVFIPDAGHFPMFEGSAPLFRAAISSWLDSRFPDPA